MTEQESTMNTDQLLDAVIAWGEKHNLHDPIMQYAKMNEEVGEIAHELTRNNYGTAELYDALGDTAVTLIILSHILGYDIRNALRFAYNQIKDRKGITENGTFVKEQ